MYQSNNVTICISHAEPVEAFTGKLLHYYFVTLILVAFKIIKRLEAI